MSAARHAPIALARNLTKFPVTTVVGMWCRRASAIKGFCNDIAATSRRARDVNVPDYSTAILNLRNLLEALVDHDFRIAE